MTFSDLIDFLSAKTAVSESPKLAKCIAIIDGASRIDQVAPAYPVPALREFTRHGKPTGLVVIGVLRAFHEWKGERGLYEVAKYAGRAACGLEAFRRGEDMKARDFAMALYSDCYFILGLYFETYCRVRRSATHISKPRRKPPGTAGGDSSPPAND